MEVVNDNTPPEETLKMAIDNIEKDFLWVGICEEFDESMLILKKKMNWNYAPVYSRENKTQKRPHLNEVSAKIREFVKEVHSHDYTLFKEMRNCLKRDIAEYGASFREC
jgi:hypothetical protein